MIEISLGSFIKFANASGRARARLARQITDQTQNDYNPATDFWRPMRHAIRKDRITTRDGEAVRQAALAAPERRRPSFEQIHERWVGVAERWTQADHLVSHTGRIDVGGLQVRANPLFAERWSDGRSESAFVWFNKEELQPETVAAVGQLLSREMHAETVRPVFIDVRRAAFTPAIDPSSSSDWIDGIATEFRRLVK